MKQIRISNANEKLAVQLVRDAKLDFLTLSKAANLAMEKGWPLVRRMMVKGEK